jgi:hypothetical protein
MIYGSNFIEAWVPAFTVGLIATAVGLDRDRAFYPTVSIVIANTWVPYDSSRPRVSSTAATAGPTWPNSSRDVVGDFKIGFL